MGNSSVHTPLVDAIKDLIQDSNFHCRDSGIALQNMDNSQVAVVVILLEAGGFLPYHRDRRLNLGISLTSLTKIVHYAGDEATLALKANDNPDTFNLVLECLQTGCIKYDIKSRDIDQEHLEIPKADYAATITIPSAEFQRICRNLSQLLESVANEASEERIKFSSSSDIGSGSATLRHNSDLTGPIALTISLKYLVNFSKATALSYSVTLSLSSEVPQLVEYKVESGFARFYFAPQIGEEEEKGYLA
ncbi:proliferating cell nuclear antigen [Choiromyces venosus 120613-1]|uniref:DNA sliding clamp PCNA n=1 Tax=Choiromyces venosus 120613-1 TaxID=1336337 RepID=A0A3N4K334_9PEZI|nr:proliferating cell nuclear antigen [Choiromyces venosus 120613-1]